MPVQCIQRLFHWPVHGVSLMVLTLTGHQHIQSSLSILHVRRPELQSNQWNYEQYFMDISLHPFNQMINQVACPQIRGLLTQFVAFPGWVIFEQLNIWTFQNPNGSLHAIRFSCFPYVQLTLSHFLQKFLII